MRLHKYKIYPTKEQKIIIDEMLKSTYFLYNYFLFTQYDSLFCLSYDNIISILKLLEKYLTCPKQMSVNVLKSVLLDLNKAIQSKKIMFKSKNSKYKKYTIDNNSVEIINKHINISQLGLIEIKKKHAYPDAIKYATLVLSPHNRYYLYIYY